MSYTEVKDVTSNAVGSEESGSLFDVTIENYERIMNKAESLLQEAVKYSFPTTFKQYLTKSQWTTIGELPSPGPHSPHYSICHCNSHLVVTDIAVTAELDLPLQVLIPLIFINSQHANIDQTLRDYLSFLHRTLSSTAYKRILRTSAASLQELLFNDVVLRQDFTTLGAARLRQDFSAIRNALAAHGTSKPLNMPKLAEVCMIPGTAYR